jgi:hexosaminidase
MGGIRRCAIEPRACFFVNASGSSLNPASGGEVMRTRYLSLVLVWVVLALALVSRANADEEHGCDDVTVDSLYHCVHHAIEMGHISNVGVGNSLLAKVDAAQAAVDRGQPKVAVRILGAFIHEVEAQAAVHIDPEHAAHMIMHAEMVIDALSP